MLEDITINLLERLSLVLVTTYLIFQTYVMRNIVGKRLFLKNKITIGIIGGFIGIVGTLSGINYNGAIVNFRDIGVILAGILGNIPGGVVAALISTTFRMFIGGITAIPCSLGTLTAGFISGVISKYHGREHFTFLRTLLYTTILEVVHLTYVLVMVKPSELAFEITFNILFPMILTNAIGVSFFNFMIINIEKQLQFTEENTMNSIFLIMEKSLSFAEKGLNKESANVIAKVILENTNFDAIALTNKDVVLAHVGSGSDHHISEWPIIDQMTQIVINSGRELSIVNREGINCIKKDCPLFSSIIIPIKDINGKLIGTLKLYYSKYKTIKNADLIFGKKLAQILSLILSIYQINKALKLTTEEKLRELMSNMSPHFLFNTLNAIKYISKEEPEKVAYFIDNLSDLLRYTLHENSQLVSVKKEVDFTLNYLKLMKLRFKDKLDYEIDFDDNIEDELIPPFLLQPLVENSIKHGMKDSKLMVKIKIERSEQGLKIIVKDNGKGFKIIRDSGKGLFLIKSRLESLYGSDYRFNIKHILLGGTMVEIIVKNKSGERV